MTAPSFMFIPSLACQASCSYCFGPHAGAVMDVRTAKEAVRFIRGIARETGTKHLTIVFHGGEPLLAPFEVWETIAKEMSIQLAGLHLHLSLQSNLWELDDAFLGLFKQMGVSIGTSLDGPRAVCDQNRGEGYYDKTSAGIQKALDAGLAVSGIATVSGNTLPFAEEIARFYRDKGMHMVLHGALPSQQGDTSYALSAAEYASLIMNLFPWYIKNRKLAHLDTLDTFVKGVVRGKPGVCTFEDCFGSFLAIAPTGDISSCQRLAGRPECRLGTVFDRPSLTELYKSAAAREQRTREKAVAERCSACEFFSICRGGCYHSARTSGDGTIDPWCAAYHAIYTFVQEHVSSEMQSAENIEAALRGDDTSEYLGNQCAHPLLRKGAYLSLASNVHPKTRADNARLLLAAYELGRTNNVHTATQSLCEQNICGDPDRTKEVLSALSAGISSTYKSRNNCYAHVTFACNLRCTHCYATAGEESGEMSPRDFERLVCDALNAGFRQLVITGGEPLVHSRRGELLRLCQKYRGRGTNLILRTNLMGNLSREVLLDIAKAFDQIVVSVDGNEQTHDARRGKGSYAKVTRNLESYAELAFEWRGDQGGAFLKSPAELSLACVLSANDIRSEPGRSVRKLGKRLHARRVRFRPLLPLGRAATWSEPVACEGLLQHVSPQEKLQATFRPLTTCGLGQNLFIKPSGAAHPCYAWCEEHTFLGNVFDAGGLGDVLDSPAFGQLLACTVDTIRVCKTCPYRYLCGGACRAWGSTGVSDPNAPPENCEHLKARAEELLYAARTYLLETDD